MRNLYLGVALAPYRVDYYNYIHDYMNCDICFQMRSFDGQLFSTEELERRCTFTPVYMNTTQIGKDRRIVRGLSRLIKDANPDFIIIPEFSLLAMQVIAIKKLHGYKFRIISQCDDSYAMLVSGGFSKLHAFSRSLCVPLMDELLLLDNRSAEWYRERYHKGLFVPMIQCEASETQGERKEVMEKVKRLHDEYGLNDVKTILFVGRLVNVKNLFRLIDACVRLTFAYRLVVVGDGVLREDLENYAERQHVDVVFVGQKNGIELTAWYCCADTFVLSSTMEPFGAVTNEALLCGCNCCISEVAGSACLIDQGVNGYLCNPLSVEDIADKITKTCGLSLNDERQSKMKYRFEEVMEEMKKHLMHE